MPHSEGYPVPVAPNNSPDLSSSDEGDSEDGASATSASPYGPDWRADNAPQLLNQDALGDLFGDLSLPKITSELLAS